MRGTTPELVGRRFGRLVVVAKTDRRERRRVLWECLCDCGAASYVRGDSLLGGKTQSCGCLNNETRKAWAKSRATHNQSDTRLYSNWKRMRQRCESPLHERYKAYGGRGIHVCDEWARDFRAFYNYVSQLPHFGEKGYTLDRINNDGNYEPGNVRWATAYTQAHNKRRKTDGTT